VFIIIIIIIIITVSDNSYHMSKILYR